MIEESRLIRLPEVMRLTGLRRTQTYAYIRAGNFPAPIKIGPRCSAWDERAVRAWIAERIAAAGNAA